MSLYESGNTKVVLPQLRLATDLPLLPLVTAVESFMALETTLEKDGEKKIAGGASFNNTHTPDAPLREDPTGYELRWPHHTIDSGFGGIVFPPPHVKPWDDQSFGFMDMPYAGDLMILVRRKTDLSNLSEDPAHLRLSEIEFTIQPWNAR